MEKTIEERLANVDPAQIRNPNLRRIAELAQEIKEKQKSNPEYKPTGSYTSAYGTE